jgi:hypothetical protein
MDVFICLYKHQLIFMYTYIAGFDAKKRKKRALPNLDLKGMVEGVEKGM